MIASEMITRIKLAIQQSEEDDDRFTDAELLGLINEGYVDFCRFTEILEKVETAVIPALTSVVSLPADFLEARQFRWGSNRTIYPQSARQMDYNIVNWGIQVQESPDNVVYLNWGSIRTFPIPSSAGTFMTKYAYIPEDLTTSDAPEFLTSFHEALIDFAVSECFSMMGDFKMANRKMDSYEERRKKARAQVKQKTPDVLLSQRPITVFNYNYFDNRYRSRR